jgi:hypothetical protein
LGYILGHFFTNSSGHPGTEFEIRSNRKIEKNTERKKERNIVHAKSQKEVQNLMARNCLGANFIKLRENPNHSANLKMPHGQGCQIFIGT